MSALLNLEPRPADATPSIGLDLGVLTLVLWLACTVVGLLGFALPYTRPRPFAPPEEPVLVQQLKVELTQDPLPPPDSVAPPTDLLTPPVPPDALAPPPMPQPIAVAQPNSAIAFALPVEGPTRIVETKRADYVQPMATNVSAASAPSSIAQPLTFGQGEGKQLAPEYPRQAVRQKQEGVVVVRMLVNPDGRVISAEAVSPSPWPLLNESALRTVRDRWRFRSGPQRLYEVPIRFELTK